MKTLREIAEEIGVSKHAIYKRCSGKLNTAMKPYMHMKDGIIYIAEQGERIIAQDFSADGAPIGDMLNKLILMLQTELQTINTHLEELNIVLKSQEKNTNRRYRAKTQKGEKESTQPIKTGVIERYIRNQKQEENSNVDVDNAPCSLLRNSHEPTHQPTAPPGAG